MANPLVIPCATSPADCAPCFVSPIANLSSEQPDRQVFLAGSWTSQQPVLDPPNGTTWDAFGCVTFCESTISQEDANLCAQRQQIYCNTGMWHNPTTGGPPPTIFLSHAQSCPAFCADGLPYTFTVPAGTFAALSQILDDRMAFTYACRQAELTKVCLSALTQNGTCGTAYSAAISLSSAVAPVTWAIISGALPPGLTLGGFSPNLDVTAGATVNIQGTPTKGGNYTFMLAATDSLGRFMEKQYTINVTNCIIANALHFSFEGNATDSNYGIAGTAIGTSFVTGILGQALDFDPLGGFNQAQLVLNASNPPAYTGGGLSHSFWVKVTADGGGAFPMQVMASQIVGNDGHVYEFDFAIFNRVNPTFSVKQDPSLFGPVVLTVTLPFTMALNGWYFFTVVYDPVAQRLKASFNANAFVSSGSTFALPAGAWNGFNIGGVLQYPVTVVDEYTIYTNYAMTQADATKVYNLGNALAWPYTLP